MSDIPEAGEFVRGFLRAAEEAAGVGLEIRRGLVAGFFPTGEPQIVMDGEDLPRDAVFTRLSAKPAVGARVFLIRAFGSWLYWVDQTGNYSTGIRGGTNGEAKRPSF